MVDLIESYHHPFEEEILEALTKHPLIQEISVFNEYCSRTNKEVVTPLQREAVKKECRHELPSVILQSVEYVTIEFVTNMFLLKIDKENLTIHYLQNEHDGFMFIFDQTKVNITLFMQELERECQPFLMYLYNNIPPPLVLKTGGEMMEKECLNEITQLWVSGIFEESE